MATMCPACMARTALMAAGAVSTGGLAALAVKLLRGIQSKAKLKENDHDKESTGQSSRSVAS
jgi:hypothetical protein